MNRINLDQDSNHCQIPSECCFVVQQVRETKRPLVITQHGRGAAVLIGATEYEAMLES
jgi:PHD/YefM family antitoxin component YafN of YafNO toxin-antitoxin module